MAESKFESSQRLWPIQGSAGQPPENWNGWPENKRFAFVLTHDVEGMRGLDRCKQLMDIDLASGFYSSFEFVPEGKYLVPEDLRSLFRQNGFEVALHDLNHDGKLYKSKSDFLRKATRINSYLDEWKVSGFRSAYMHHNLEWLKNLNIEYDSSTFDTDPFEPQSDGVETIYPFWVERDDKTGFVELPYTLVQDFNLFIILKKTNIDIWKRKLDWIAYPGGMALLNTHPDYMNLSSDNTGRFQYPLSYYTEFLDYVKCRYGGQYWNATPGKVAEFVKPSFISGEKNSSATPSVIPVRRTDTKKIWIDLDNTPHVPFFKPIIKELKKQGHSVLLTARDAYQVIELADEMKMEFVRVGRHYGKNKAAKVWGLLYRAMQMAPIVVPYMPDLAISHGARSQTLLCNLLGIPSILLADYEFVKLVPMAKPSWIIVPEAMSDHAISFPLSKVRKYPGIKENVYAPYFRPDASLSETLELKQNNLIVTVRPPATEAHYHCQESDVLFDSLMNYLVGKNDLQIVLLPRNNSQKDDLLQNRPGWFADGKTMIPVKAVDGLNLIWNSDLVVSGGGTMNREAAALDVPVYSIFRGPIGSIDKYLQASGKLTLIEHTDDIDTKILLVKRRKDETGTDRPNKTLESILGYIDEILAT